MRLELSRKTDLATRGMIFLLHSDHDPVAGRLLAAQLDTTIHYLPQVMKPLVREGWVASIPGPNGGYSATESASSVSMLELIEAVEGPLDDGRCILKEGPCGSFERCALHEAWTRAQAALVDELQATPVVDGADPSRVGHPHTRRETTRE